MSGNSDIRHIVTKNIVCFDEVVPAVTLLFVAGMMISSDDRQPGRASWFHETGVKVGSNR
jgi:hypothetical protein